jgi:hypothetical protein
MRKIAMRVGAAAILISCAAGCAQSPQAAQTPLVTPQPTRQIVQPLDCHGTTGWHGCGAGWFWRNGENGWACYPC